MLTLAAGQVECLRDAGAPGRVREFAGGSRAAGSGAGRRDVVVPIALGAGG